MFISHFIVLLNNFAIIVFKSLPKSLKILFISSYLKNLLDSSVWLTTIKLTYFLCNSKCIFKPTKAPLQVNAITSYHSLLGHICRENIFF